MNASPFILFGNVHLVTIAIIVLVAVLLPLVCKNQSTSNKSLISKIIAFIILSHVIISPYKDLYLLQNQQPKMHLLLIVLKFWLF